ncbi:MAG: Zn-dependent oxidoreductase [Microbacteriaceae bacterium]|jgi:putative PIG3 family NAD(P)H quinone oxidoreductase|nr:Zn-dependent oxidoreductase [Microbacteriaceae bacterium]
MQAITVPHAGGPEALVLTEVADPVPNHREVLIAVAAAGVNRADLSQRAGGYPPPDGASPLLGLEVSGTIAEVGAGVSGWTVGDRVCALLAGGGYAPLAVAGAGHLLPVPDSVDLEDAAALPEAIATVWSNVVMIAGLRAGETFLVHGGSSGIGTIAIQLASTLGCLVATTAGSVTKLRACEALGADILIDYHEEDFVESVLNATDGRGADVILDAIGGDYFDRNLRALAPHGRLVMIGNQSGARGTADIRLFMSKWLSVHGSMLRARPSQEKDDIIASVRANAWPLVASGQIVPVIHERFALADARRAHEMMESSAHIGKLLLIP